MIIQDIYGGGIPLKYEEYYDKTLNAKVYYKKPLFKNIDTIIDTSHEPSYTKKIKSVHGAKEDNKLYHLLINDSEYSAKFIYTLSYLTNNYNNILRYIYQFGYIDYEILIKKYPIGQVYNYHSVDEKHVITYAEETSISRDLHHQSPNKKDSNHITIHQFNDPTFIQFLTQYQVIEEKKPDIKYADLSIEDIIVAMQSIGFKHVETKTMYGFDTQIIFDA